MTKLIALIYLVLSLYGCDVGGSTFVHRVQRDGVDTLHSRVVAQPGLARFECLRSASGQCHYIVLPRACAANADAEGQRAGNCQSAPPERFAVADGDTRQIARLRRFRVCVSAEGTPATGADCAAPAIVASR